MNFHGIFIFGLMAIVGFSISSSGTDAFLLKWALVKLASEEIRCEKNSDCLDAYKCHKGSCVYGCSDGDCDSSATCSVVNHEPKCSCWFFYELKDGKKCEFSLIPNFGTYSIFGKLGWVPCV